MTFDFQVTDNKYNVVIKISYIRSLKFLTKGFQIHCLKELIANYLFLQVEVTYYHLEIFKAPKKCISIKQGNRVTSHLTWLIHYFRMYL